MLKDKESSLDDKRYESVMRMLDLEFVRPKRKRKFLIIQVDSLPYSILKRFLDGGSCRFIKSLIEKEGYNFQKYNCGIPSTTPAIQAGIMYGKNSMIPGFRFVDKKSKRQFSFGNPNHVKYLEDRFFRKSKGILEGGSSYSNHFSGGAERSILTMSTMTRNKHFRRVKESSLWLFLFLHPASLFRVIYYSLAELLIEAGEVVTYPVRSLFSKRKAIFGFRLPFRRVLMNVILAEIITIGVILDIKRGVPKIYMNYMNYDDIAHLRGPNSASAYFMVRAADRRIKRIMKRIRDDSYDVFIMSDHGQVEAVPFRAVQGMTLAKFIEKCARVESFGLTSAHEGRLTMMGVVLRKMLGFLKYVSTPLRWSGRVFTRGMLRVLRPKRYRFVWDDKEKIFVLDSCSLANVYFNVSKERMDLKAIDRKYPKLVDKLVRNRYIGFVMVRRGGDVLLLNSRGSVRISRDGVKKKGRDFLKDYGDPDIIVEQVRKYDRFRFIGDLVIFGRLKDGVAVSFTEHVGAHGGLGKDINHPFFISRRKFDLSGVKNAQELHSIFRGY